LKCKAGKHFPPASPFLYFFEKKERRENVKWLDRFEEALIAVFLLISACLVTLNVILRSMGGGIVWSEELVRYLIIWMTFVGTSICIREGTHVTVDLLPQLVKGRGSKKVLKILIQLFAFLFSIGFVHYSLLFFRFATGTSQVAPSLGIPMYLVYIVLPLSGLLMMVREGQKFVALFYKSPTNL